LPLLSFLAEKWLIYSLWCVADKTTFFRVLRDKIDFNNVVHIKPHFHCIPHTNFS
jgi:hypothetical protein